MRVVVAPPDPRWTEMFDAEAKRLAEAMGPIALAIHHIGSTAIPGIHAKPIIDLLIEVASLDDVDERNPAIIDLGYEVLGEFGIPGRRYFRRCDATGDRTHQAHSFERGAADIERHLAFRDFMRAHLGWAGEYSDLKRKLAKAHPDDIERYMDGKDAFMKAMERKAAAWRAETVA